ncbi:hypothetical protein K440DRAFT_646084 [Wilcoxina mikolae CBS 423.85]|nr:hypothetical protein K440DRAFT_646084 [Wilcoxina mikolae CBS 423.85]
MLLLLLLLLLLLPVLLLLRLTFLPIAGVEAKGDEEPSRLSDSDGLIDWLVVLFVGSLGRWVVVSCRRVRRGELGGNDQVGRCSRVVVYDVPRSCVVVLFLSLVARGEVELDPWLAWLGLKVDMYDRIDMSVAQSDRQSTKERGSHLVWFLGTSRVALLTFVINIHLSHDQWKVVLKAPFPWGMDR